MSRMKMSPTMRTKIGSSGPTAAVVSVFLVGLVALVAAGLLAVSPPAGAAVPARAAPGGAPPPGIFATGDRCMACHNGLTTPAGEDVSIGTDWRASMMAQAARDPYWQASVRRETVDHPAAAAAIESECATCHMPMAHTMTEAAGGTPGVFVHLPVVGGVAGGGALAPLAVDGVSCALCHQVGPERLGTRESFVGGFVVDTVTPPGERPIFGPFAVEPGLERIMRSAVDFRPIESRHVQSSELCATCHTLFTHALGPGGEVVGELPEQVPYLEWRHSAYRESMSCQSCHMPVVASDTAISSVLGEPRTGFSRHVFRGGNFFMPRLLARYRAELGVVALPLELETTARRTAEHLQKSAARVTVESLERTPDGRLELAVVVENLAGHKLPTAYPSRRAWLHVTVKAGKRTVFESGALAPDGSIEGNDNDADGSRYEPHYRVIDTPDEVAIYEAILADPDGAVTTGLLRAVGFAKDNRLLPDGFDKATAGDDVAVHGGARDDEDFAGGGDRVVYRIDPGDRWGREITVEAELWYQPIGFRWARNLEPVPGAEPARFVAAFDAMAEGSGIVLARGTATLPARSDAAGAAAP